MLLLLSPAKTMAPNLPNHPEMKDALTEPIFLKEATSIVRAIRAWSKEKTQRELKLSPTLADRVWDWYQSWKPDGSCAAGWTFQGDAYKSLDFSSFDQSTAIAASKRLRILHGVYGILRPLDRFSPVRLEMGQPWCHSSSHPNMASFWRTKLHVQLQNELRAQGNRFILNLASLEYSDVALHGIQPELVMTCRFLDERNGTFKSISSFSKSARGAMARYVLSENIQNPEQLQTFRELGYAFDPDRSTSREFVFVRPLRP